MTHRIHTALDEISDANDVDAVVAMLLESRRWAAKGAGIGALAGTSLGAGLAYRKHRKSTDRGKKIGAGAVRGGILGGVAGGFGALGYRKAYRHIYKKGYKAGKIKGKVPFKKSTSDLGDYINNMAQTEKGSEMSKTAHQHLADVGLERLKGRIGLVRGAVNRLKAMRDARRKKGWPGEKKPQ